MTSKTDTDGTRPRPHLTLEVREDGAGVLNGQVVVPAAAGNVRATLLRIIGEVATATGTPLQIQARDPQGTWDLTAWPNGAVTEHDTTAAADRWYVAAHDPATAPATAIAPAPATPAAPATGLVTPPSPPVQAAAIPGPVRTAPATTALAPSRLTAPQHQHQQLQILTRAVPVVDVVTPTSVPRPRRALPTVAGIIAVVATACLAVVFVIGPGDSRGDSRRPRPSATAAAVTPTSTPTPTITAVPQGFASRPAWAVPIADWTRSFATDDGIVLTRDPEGHILLLDPATGDTRWTSQETTTRDQAGPWPTTIDGARAAAVITPGQLTYWPLPAAAPTSASQTTSTIPTPTTTSSTLSTKPTPGLADAGRSVPLPPDATVTWTGPSPLVQRPDHTAAVIRAGTLLPVPLPPGAVALAADDVGVLAATSTSWILQPAASSVPVAPRALPRPDGVGRTPLRVEALGTSYLLTIWARAKGPGQVIALMDVATGTNVVRTDGLATADLRTYAAVREAGGTQLAIGPVVVDTYLHRIDLFDITYRVKALTRGHAWAVHDNKPVDLPLKNGGVFVSHPFDGQEAALPIGATRLPSGDDRLVVITHAGDGWMLCGLSPINSNTPLRPSSVPR